MMDNHGAFLFTTIILCFLDLSQLFIDGFKIMGTGKLPTIIKSIVNYQI